MIRTWKAKTTTRIQLLIEQGKQMAQLKREQDLKNNNNFESKYFKPATNQPSIELGYSLGLTRLGHKTT